MRKTSILIFMILISSIVYADIIMPTFYKNQIALNPILFILNLGITLGLLSYLMFMLNSSKKPNNFHEIFNAGFFKLIFLVTLAGFIADGIAVLIFPELAGSGGANFMIGLALQTILIFVFDVVIISKFNYLNFKKKDIFVTAIYMAVFTNALILALLSSFIVTLSVLLIPILLILLIIFILEKIIKKNMGFEQKNKYKNRSTAIIVTLVFLIFLMIGAMIAPPPKSVYYGYNYDPINETQKILSDAIDRPSAIQYTHDVAFQPGDVLSAQAITTRTGISKDQICMGANAFYEDEFELYSGDDTYHRLIYNGSIKSTVKIAVVCNLSFDDLKDDIITYDFDDKINLNSCPDSCKEGGICCAVILMRT